VGTPCRAESEDAPQASPRASPTASPTPSPKPSPRGPLRLDIDAEVDKLLERDATQGIPRFESSVDVEGKTPDERFRQQLKGYDVDCGPGGGGPPNEAEMRAVRPHNSPSADFLGLARFLGGKLKKKNQEQRFFLYRVQLGPGVSYIVREGHIGAAELANTVGATFEEIAGFPDAKSAAEAERRMEQGFATPTSSGPTSPAPNWVTTNCRPSKN
jgi:hypothetical protein